MKQPNNKFDENAVAGKVKQLMTEIGHLIARLSLSYHLTKADGGNGLLANLETLYL